MKLAIMQPYIFPYIGYFQLLALADQFVIYDDAQWMKGGWINRNRILIDGSPSYFTLPVEKTSHKTQIRDRFFTLDIDHHKNKFLRQLQFTYSKAPNYHTTAALISDCLGSKQQNISIFIVDSLRRCCEFMGIETRISLSSSLDTPDDLVGEAKVIEISKLLGAEHYINLAGGRALYSAAHFTDAGIQLGFLNTAEVVYPQFPGHPFQPSLSIIDVLMFNSATEISLLLEQYNLQTVSTVSLASK